ncbi:MAG: DUF1501 domain-containing protein [Candidatus Hydrogenedentes bacterium]|nr:DUF1501 domain-containing protein [Candidatus Hydrogenedentota bacterium]
MSRRSSFSNAHGSHHNCPCPGPSRRDFLKVGVLGGLGLTLGDYFHLLDAQAQEAVHLDQVKLNPSPKAQSAIFIFLAGGMSHIDTFDPKPYAPIEYRGELGSVKTKTGDVFGGQLPKLAEVSDRFSVIRSMTHGEAAHERGTHNMLTGFRPSPAVQYPSFGSVVSHLYGPRKDLPPYIAIPGASDPFMGTGYLSSAYGPFSVGGEPQANEFQVRDLNLPNGVTPERMEQRKGLLAAVDSHFSQLEKGDSLDAMDNYYQRAYALISSQNAREAFDIKSEPEEARNQYGRNTFGQRLLLARRLVEAGARFVTVYDGGWDHHINIKGAMEGKLPEVDLGLSVLFTDLEARGLLETTMVVLVTEFGRTVRINNDGGRDHWPKAFSIALAGGGIKGGIIHGETDRTGAEPSKDPVGPEDLAATLFTQLGIDPTGRLMSAGNRTIDVVRHGKLIETIV